jgi:hypothetical protein
MKQAWQKNRTNPKNRTFQEQSFQYVNMLTLEDRFWGKNIPAEVKFSMFSEQTSPGKQTDELDAEFERY